VIIDTFQQLETLVQDITDKDIILVPIAEDEHSHPIANSIIAYYIKVFEGQEYLILQNHPEANLVIAIQPILEKAQKIYCSNKTLLRYNGVLLKTQVIDGLLQNYLATGETPEQHSFKSAEFYSRRVPFKTNIFVDAMKLQEYGRKIAEQIHKTENSCESFYEDMFSQVFQSVESNGIQVDKSKFTTTFPEYPIIGSRVYTKYNFYTSTGRPSNRFGGVNFAALNKEDDTRSSIISRHENGILLEMDFQSYHPRILADLIGYDMGTENAYEHLAKHYFNTATPTAEEINSSKELTFKQIYGGINKKYLNIEYFNKVQHFTDYLWDYYTKNGLVQSKISKREIRGVEDVTPTKLLNYFIQLQETEQNTIFLYGLLNVLDEDIVPILYTYDSILFDLPQQKLKVLERILSNIIPKSFPYRLKKGTNYKDLA
jgi:hypothetical protein